MRLDSEALALGVAALVIVGAGGWLVRRHATASTKPGVPARALVRATSPIVDDGVFEDDAWPEATLGGAFVDDHGAEARPHSELRLLWDPAGLHLAVYAADGDIEPSDAFSISISDERGAVVELTVTPTRVSRRGGAELVAGHDVDGTIGEPKDDDEEWVTEFTVPWAELGAKGAPGERIVVSSSRCDDTKTTEVDRHERRCAAMPRATFELR